MKGLPITLEARRTIALESIAESLAVIAKACSEGLTYSPSSEVPSIPEAILMAVDEKKGIQG